MQTTAWREREGGRAEVTVAEALESREDVYLCLACGERVVPTAATEGAHARFEHDPGAAPCRRSPRRPDRRKSLRTGGRRAGD